MNGKLDKHIQELLTHKGFDSAFYARCRYFDSLEEAYENLESLYIIHFGLRRYKNYESYRVTKTTRMKNASKKRIDNLEKVFIITTYNRPKSLKVVIDKIKGLGQIIVINDGSTEDYNFLKDYDIILLENITNIGKRGYYETVTRLFQALKNIKYDYAYMLPDDMVPVRDFEKTAIKIYEKIKDNRKVCLNLYLSKSRYLKRCWTNFDPILYDNYIHSNWVDMCFMAPSKFFELLNYEVKPIMKNWDEKPLQSSGVGSQISRTFERMFYNMYQVKNSLLDVQKAAFTSKMNPEERLINQEINKPIM